MIFADNNFVIDKDFIYDYHINIDKKIIKFYASFNNIGNEAYVPKIKIIELYKVFSQ